MELLQIFLLAAASMFWPLLLIVVIAALSTNHPVRILGWFWAGGMLTTVTVGAGLVFVLQDSSLMSGKRLPSAPEVEIVVGLLALLAAYVLRNVARRRAIAKLLEPAPPGKKPSKSSEWVDKIVASGGPIAFVGGIVGSIVPSPLVVLGMAEIAQLGYPAGATFAVIVAFFLVMFSFIEAPIVGFAVAPERTQAAARAAHAWLTRNLLWLAVWALALVGVYQLVRGILNAATG